MFIRSIAIQKNDENRDCRGNNLNTVNHKNEHHLENARLQFIMLRLPSLSFTPSRRILYSHRTSPRVKLSRRVVMSAGSCFGHAFRVSTFGESHGKGVGCVVDGVPPRLMISEEEIQFELDRRRPGQSIITTPRSESDTCEILSGIFDGVTLGTPIAILVRNKDQKSKDYSEMEVAYR